MLGFIRRCICKNKFLVFLIEGKDIIVIFFFYYIDICLVIEFFFLRIFSVGVDKLVFV